MKSYRTGRIVGIISKPVKIDVKFRRVVPGGHDTSQDLPRIVLSAVTTRLARVLCRLSNLIYWIWMPLYFFLIRQDKQDFQDIFWASSNPVNPVDPVKILKI